jgi:hypothetical protein
MKSFVRKLSLKYNALVAFCKSWLFSKYFALFESFTLKCLLFTNKQVRKLILMKGKDPDYVAPPSVSAPPPDPWEELQAKRKLFTNITLVSHPEWVNDLSKHPVLKSRRLLEQNPLRTAPPVEDFLQVAKAESDPVPVEIAASSVEDELNLFLAEPEDKITH